MTNIANSRSQIAKRKNQLEKVPLLRQAPSAVRHANNGFTLIELLVVIAIVAILALVVLVAINPLDQLKKGRNSRRLSDLGEVKKAIDLGLLEATGTGAPFPSGSTSDSCAGTRAVDGTGWVRYNSAAALDLSKSIPTLPIDPKQPGNCYKFITSADGQSYKLTAVLEDVGTAATDMSTDGGNIPGEYEVGSNMQL